MHHIIETIDFIVDMEKCGLTFSIFWDKINIIVEPIVPIMSFRSDFLSPHPTTWSPGLDSPRFASVFASMVSSATAAGKRTRKARSKGV